MTPLLLTLLEKTTAPAGGGFSPSLMQTLIAAGSFLLSVLAWYSATRASTKARTLEHAKVDAAAYTSAQAIYDKAIEQLRKQNEQLEKQLSRCESRVDQLEVALRDAGIRTPPELYRVRTEREDRP